MIALSVGGEIPAVGRSYDGATEAAKPYTKKGGHRPPHLPIDVSLPYCPVTASVCAADVSYARRSTITTWSRIRILSSFIARIR